MSLRPDRPLISALSQRSDQLSPSLSLYLTILTFPLTKQPILHLPRLPQIPDLHVESIDRRAEGSQIFPIVCFM